MLFSLAWLFYNYISLLSPVDPGDGLVHYFYSAASWQQPIYFLDLWSKPLFTLLTSPFAQFGFGGMVFFNGLVFFLTTVFAWKILIHFQVNRYFLLSFPLLLLLTQDYTNTLLGGHTEPLFSLLLVIAIWLWIKEKHSFFAFIIGLLLFSRSEGQLPFLLGFLLLTYIRQWKSLVFLFLPFLIYAIIGFFAFEDFLWYFNRSPYNMNNDIYGVGTYDHYILSYKNYLGNHGLFLFILAIPATFLHFVKKEFSLQTCGMTFLAYGTFIGIIVAHSYFWGTGQNGSMGLTRIATQGLPAFLICQFYFLQKTPWKWQKLNTSMSLVLAGILALYLVFTPYLIKETKPLELLTKQIAENHRCEIKGKKILSSHPYFCFLLGENYLEKNSRVTLLNYGHMKPFPSQFDFLFWDSHFGPQESSVPLGTLREGNGFKPLSSAKKGLDEVFLFEIVGIKGNTP